MTTYRAIFCDIDGTLLDTSHKLRPATIARAAAVCASGTPFVLVSARMPNAMYGIQEELGIRAPMVCYGGALVLDSERRPVHSVMIDASLAAELMARLTDGWPDFAVSMYAHEMWLANDIADPRVRGEAVITGVSPVPPMAENLADRGGPLHKMFCVGEPDRIAHCETELLRDYPGLSVGKSSPRYLEIMNGGATKANALRALCRAMRIDPSEVVAFGDNYNDIDMLEAAGLGVAMGNAPEAVKNAADRVTVDNDHDGVAAMLDGLEFRPMTNSVRFVRGFGSS